MDEGFKFDGFSQETFGFLGSLENNNNRDWFEAHRGDYEKYVLTPAGLFVVGLGGLLKTISPRIYAIPGIDKSIFRLRRDTRFSADKTPYKTHLGMLFWEGPGKKLENPNYYVQLSGSSLFIGAGEYRFPPDAVKIYRDSVVRPKAGARLGSIIGRLSENPSFKIGGKHYKRIPRGYDGAHPNAGLLLHNGLFVYYEGPLPREVYTPRFVEYCFDILSEMSPLFRWLVNVMEETRGRK